MAQSPLQPTAPRDAFGTAPEHVEDRLSAAIEAFLDGEQDRCEALLWEAHRRGPDALAVHFELYRFYLDQEDLFQAERTARLALAAAARVGGFTADWRNLPERTERTPAFHFALVTLKTLAQVLLRRGSVSEAGCMLVRLEELDPLDTVGHGAVAALFGWPER